VDPWQVGERLRKEKEVLGFYVSGHPLDKVRAQLAALVRDTAAGAAELATGTDVGLGGVVAGVKGMRDRRGNPMAFFTLEDYTGTIEVIAFSSVYESARPLIHSDTPILVTGRLDRREDEPPKVIADAVVPLADAGLAGDRRLEVRVPRDKCDPATLAEVRSILIQHTGSMPVALTIDTGSSRATLAPRLRVAVSAGLLEPLHALLGPGNVRLSAPRDSVAPANGGTRR
jgi:DNA polymerase-3 subunit alpha